MLSPAKLEKENGQKRRDEPVLGRKARATSSQVVRCCRLRSALEVSW